jgi:secreted Zn-dependent insulinase-like peptidase
VEEMQEFVNSLFAEVKFDVLAHGNIKIHEATEFVEKLQDAFSLSVSLSDSQRPTQQVTELPSDGKVRVIQVEHSDPENPNHALMHYWQFGVNTRKHNAITSVLRYLIPCSINLTFCF